MSRWLAETRFFEKPKNIEVPLYKFRNSVFEKRAVSLDSAVETDIAQRLGFEETSIFLGHSATDSFLAFFKTLPPGARKKVAVPHFFCHHFALRAILNEVELVFYGLNEKLEFDEKSYKNIDQDQISVVIVPSLFSIKNHNMDLLNALTEKGIYVIHDMAQTYPLEKPWRGVQDPNKVIELFSFGHSKSLQGVGGGGICVRDPVLRGQMQALINMEEVHFHNALPSSLKFENYPEIIEHELKTVYSKAQKHSYLQMTEAQRHVYKERVTLFNQEKEAAHGFLKAMGNLFEEKFGENSTRFIGKDPSQISILAFFIPTHLRSDLALRYASFGVESTWYFYELNRIDGLPDFEHSADISSHVFILPFSRMMTSGEYEKLIEITKQVLSDGNQKNIRPKLSKVC